MFNIAIILFPGLNTEAETGRAIEEVGMTPTFVRWNDHGAKLNKFDGYIIGGGFSYEDRGRAGLIAAKDPIMETLKEQMLLSKPILGICNGAQILVESGLIPGASSGEVSMCVGRNKRIKDNHVLGTGYYNTWVYFKSTVPQKRCAFTYSFPEGTLFSAPIAHGEGRFVTAHVSLFPQLIENRQIVFRYCDQNGVISDEFPINPNGASFNTAAICNPEGNVMAIMPHPERGFTPPAQQIFYSMKEYLFERKKRPVYLTSELKLHMIKDLPNEVYQPLPHAVEMVSKLIITDNEAETIQSTLQRLGFESIHLQRFVHFEIKFAHDYQENDLRKIIQSAELVNTHKETVWLKTRDGSMRYDHGKKQFVVDSWPLTSDSQEISIENNGGGEFSSHSGIDFSRFSRMLFVREKEDFIGQAKTEALAKALPNLEVLVNRSVLWLISGLKGQRELEKVFKTYMLYSPHAHQFVYYQNIL